MKYRYLLWLLTFCLLPTSCCAEPAEGYQSVGGDFGKAWLKDFMADNPAPVESNTSSNSLWSWGGAPKGSKIINGKLMADPYYIWKSLNYSDGWLGQAYVDPTTGNPVYAYIDPYTGYPVYFYMDPNSGKPVYINPGFSGFNNYSGISPYYSPIFGLPTALDYPWLGPLDTNGYDGTSYYSGTSGYGGPTDYGGMGMI